MNEKRTVSAYEQRQIELIERWMRPRVSYSIRGLRAAKGATGSLARRVLPNGTVEKIDAKMSAIGAHASRIAPTGAIEGALNANIWVAHQWTRETAVLKELGIADFEQAKDLELEKLDVVANKTQNLAIGVGGLAGATGGAGGLLLAAPSVVAIMNLTVRTIRQIGLCYGFHHNDHIERAYLLDILSLVGGGREQGAKLSSAKLLQETLVMINQKTFKSMAEKAARERALKEAFITNIREVAKSLGYQLTRSRLQTAIPIVGGGVGLLLDGNYMRNVGWTARHHYQRRWLHDRGRWPESIDMTSDSLVPRSDLKS